MSLTSICMFLILIIKIIPLQDTNSSPINSNKRIQLAQQLNLINKSIQKYSIIQQEHFLNPAYHFVKIQYSVFVLDDSALKKYNLKQNPISVLNSINIYDEQGVSYPMLFILGDQYYSLKAKKIINFNNYEKKENQIHRYISSSRAQFTFFAQIQRLQNDSKEIINVHKLVFNNRKGGLEKQLIAENNVKQFGKIISFCNAFSLNRKLFAFSTDKNYILFYRSGDNKAIQQKFRFNKTKGESSSNLQLLRINNNILAYSYNMMYVITNSNPSRSQNIKQCVMPTLDKQEKIQKIVYDGTNWKQFYVKIGLKIYVYEYDVRCGPIMWFPLWKQGSQFMVAGDMLIITNQKYRRPVYYFNLTNQQINIMKLPQNNCKVENSWITVAARSLKQHILCDHCIVAGKQNNQLMTVHMSCYTLDMEQGATIDHTDYSKMRMPLVIVSLFVIVYIGIKKKQNGEDKEDKEGVYQKMITRKMMEEDSRNAKIYNKVGKQPKYQRQFPKGGLEDLEDMVPKQKY